MGLDRLELSTSRLSGVRFEYFFRYFFVAFAPAKSHTIVYAPVALAKCAAK